MTIVHDPRCSGYHQPGHPEKPNRVVRSAEQLRWQKALELRWAEPVAVSDELLLRGHTPAHLERMRQPGDFDADTPWHPEIEAHARRGVGAAVRAMELALAGESSFSLMRPPGHHAERGRAMGFCYYGSIALAVLEARARSVGRIAVFDFDVHHGNGTQDILAGVEGVTFVSVHQGDAYPGTGVGDFAGNCLNFPVAGGLPRRDWIAAFERGLAAVAAARPQLLAVSAGFDAYERDPLADGRLEREDYHWLGSRIRSLGVPHFSVLEGGYSLDLPDLIQLHLLGLEGR
jgi:acetoin utilization deacetylase AcuC-like enzyme